MNAGRMWRGRSVDLFCVLFVLLTACAGASAAGVPSEEAARLKRACWDPFFAAETFADSDLLDSARRPEVREWIWQQVDTTDMVTAARDTAINLFRLMVMADVTASDIAKVAAGGKSDDLFPFGRFAEEVLARAPSSLSPVIESRLLGLLAERAATTWDADLAYPLWLASARFAPGRVDALLKAQVKNVSAGKRKKSRFSNQSLAFLEIRLTGVDGKPVTEGLLAGVTDVARQRFGVLWPDGVVRQRYWLPRSSGDTVSQPWTLRLAVPGYPTAPDRTCTLRGGQTTAMTLKLPARLAILRGKLDAAPQIPLFATVVPSFPLGSAPASPVSGMAAVRADGSFETPCSPLDKKTVLLVVHDATGNVLASLPASKPADGASVDLGGTKLGVETLLRVPVLIAWPKGVPFPSSIQADIRWASKIGGAAGITHCRMSKWSAEKDPPPFRLGTALNVPPGEYTIEASFTDGLKDRDVRVAPVRMAVTVDAGTKLVLEPAVEVRRPGRAGRN